VMTASRALLRLQDRGFIVAVKKGAFSLKRRHATEWRLTEYPCNATGEGASEDFRHWRPVPEPAPRKSAKPPRTPPKTAAPPPWHTPTPSAAKPGNGASHPKSGVCAQCHSDSNDGDPPILLTGADGHPEGIWLHKGCMRNWAHSNLASVSPVQH
jgi:hypothetical protein